MGPKGKLPDQGWAHVQSVDPVHLDSAEPGPEGRRRAQAERPRDHKGKDIAPTETPKSVDDDAGLADPLDDQQAQADPGQPPGPQGPQHPVRGPQRSPGDQEAAM